VSGRGLRSLTIAAALVLNVLVAAVPSALASGSSVFVDAPHPNQVVGRDFHLGGWAIDWEARANTGIQTVHVWAYPAGGAPPIFLGVPIPGARPDVAAAFGANFLNCGYGLNVHGLAPGAYMLAIFPYSALRGGFDYANAVAVNITVSATATTPIPTPTPTPNPDPQPDPDPQPAGAETLKVLQWNIHHGVGTDGKYDLGRFATWMARWNPDIVTINEAEKNTSWGNEDQPARFKALLEQHTGVTWYAHFAQEFGDWAANGKGNLILSKFPFASTGREVLDWDRTMAIATVVVHGRNISLVSTHLDPDSKTRRESQARQVVALAAGWGTPRLVTGDFNAWPDQSSIGVMTGAYTDGWARAESAGAASSFSGNSPFGATKNGRIDYVFYVPGASVLTLKTVQVPDTRDASGVMPSDHRPVLATFDVR